jgi:hypothetical protein
VVVDPGAEGAAGVVLGEAAPELEVDVLGEVAAFFGIGFVGAGEALEGGAEFVGGLAVEVVLCFAHDSIVAETGRF